jgi:hypothetical protein
MTSPHCKLYSNTSHVASCIHALDYLDINLSPHEVLRMKQSYEKPYEKNFIQYWHQERVLETKNSLGGFLVFFFNYII